MSLKLPDLEIYDPEKPLLLLLSDDMRMTSGIGTMSREIVVNTSDVFNWFQLGAGLEHPDVGKMFDLSEDINKEVGINNANVKVMPWNGYGNPRVLRSLIKHLNPDGIVHFTDPRFWIWLYQMEHEIRQTCPIIYYAIWDDTPYPYYNKLFYSSCDLIMGISKQSHNIHKNVLSANPDLEIFDLTTNDSNE